MTLLAAIEQARQLETYRIKRSVDSVTVHVPSTDNYPCALADGTPVAFTVSDLRSDDWDYKKPERKLSHVTEDLLYRGLKAQNPAVSDEFTRDQAKKIFNSIWDATK